MKYISSIQLSHVESWKVKLSLPFCYNQCFRARAPATDFWYRKNSIAINSILLSETKLPYFESFDLSHSYKKTTRATNVHNTDYLLSRHNNKTNKFPAKHLPICIILSYILILVLPCKLSIQTSIKGQPMKKHMNNQKPIEI